MGSLTYIILSGGRSTRLGSDKASTVLGGRTLLQNLLEKLPRESVKVVVGDRIDGPGEVIWTREEPAFGGPVSALEAALSHLSTEYLALLAVDMPFGPELVGALMQTPMNDFDALIPMDDEGFPQPLSAIYRTDAVHRAIHEMAPVTGKSMRELLSHLNYSQIRLGADFTSMLIDIDTPSDLEKVRNARVD